MSYDSPVKYSSEREQYLLLSQQLRKLEDMFDLQQSDHQQLLRSIEDLHAKIGQLTDENNRLHSLFSESEARGQELEAEIDSLGAVVERKEATIARLRDELKSATHANAKSIGEQQSLQEQIVRLNKEQEKLLKDYEVLMDQCDKVTGQLDSQTQANTRLKAEAESATGRWTQAAREGEAQSRRVADAEYLMSAIQTKYEAAVLTIKDLKHEVDTAKEMALQAQQDVRHLREARDSTQSQLKSEISDLEAVLADMKSVVGRKDEEIAALVERCQQLQTTVQGAGKLQGQVSEMTKVMDSKDATIVSQDQDLQLLERANRDLEAESRDLQKQLRAQNQEMSKMAQHIESLKQQLRSLSRSEDSLKRYLEKKERMLDMRAQAEAELRTALHSVDLVAKRLV